MPLPLGYSYITSVSGAPGVNAKFIGSEAAQLCSQAILHEDIPSDPNDHTLPHPDYYDKFVMAVGLANPNWGYNDENIPDVDLPLGPGIWNNQPDRKPNWTYLIPEDTSFTAILREAFAWYKQYGPLPEDSESDSVTFFNGWDSPPEFKENVTKQRIVYFYVVTWEGPKGGAASGVIRGITSMNLVAQIQGMKSKDEWILPQKWGESIPFVYSNGDGTWKAIFDFNRYTTENAQAIAAVCIAIMSAIVTCVTLGAGSVALAFGAALIAGMSAVIKAGLSGNTAGVIAGVVQMGMAVIQANQDSGAAAKEIAALSKATGGNSDKVVGWVNDVAKPFVALYQGVEKIRAQVGTASAYLSSAKSIGLNMPVVNEDYWKKACDPAFLGPFSFWATKAKKFANEQSLKDYVDRLPWYAQDIGGFGASIKMTEIVQEQNRLAKSSTSLHAVSPAFQSYLQNLGPQGGKGYLQAPTFLSDILPKYKPEIGTGVEKAINPPMSTPKKVAIGVGAGFVIWKLIGLFL